MIRYASNYRNRPVLSVTDYNTNEKLKDNKGCTCRTNATGLALILALTIGVSKCNHEMRQENKQYEIIINEQQRILDSLNYLTNKNQKV